MPKPPAKSPARSPALYRAIGDDLRRRIEAGEFVTGGPLPPIKALAAHYGASALTVVRGLNVLKEEGLVTTTWGGGTYVGDGRPPRPRLETVLTLIVTRGEHSDLEPPMHSYLSRIFRPVALGVQHETALRGLQNRNILVPAELLAQPTALQDYLRAQSVPAQGAICLWGGITAAMADAITAALQCPVIFNDMTLRVLEKFDCVQIDLEANARRVVEHLIELGHRRIACIAGPAEDAIYYRARLDAWRAALAAHGLPAGRELIFLCEDRHAAIAAACERLLAMGARRRATAVFAFNDYRALALLEMATARGIAVPQQLAIAGFDGAPQALQAGLTTVQLPLHAMGRMAVQLLELIVAGELSRPVRQLFSTGVVVGRTTVGDEAFRRTSAQ